MSANRAASVLHTRINYWPAMIDMLTSLLMFFLLIYFVEHNFSAGSAELSVARQRQGRFAASLQREFRREIADGQVAYSADLKLLQVRFGEGVLFLPGEHELLPRGQRLLGRLARVFHSLDEGGALYEQIQIEGHTDDVPARRPRYPRDNWELSTARATSVLRYLTRRVGNPLDEGLMSVNGYADNRPVDPGRRDLNRRIEIRIYFSGRPQAAAAGVAR